MTDGETDSRLRCAERTGDGDGESTVHFGAQGTADHARDRVHRQSGRESRRDRVRRSIGASKTRGVRTDGGVDKARDIARREERRRPPAHEGNLFGHDRLGKADSSGCILQLESGSARIILVVDAYQVTPGRQLDGLRFGASGLRLPFDHEQRHGRVIEVDRGSVRRGEREVVAGNAANVHIARDESSEGFFDAMTQIGPGMPVVLRIVVAQVQPI